MDKKLKKIDINTIKPASYNPRQISNKQYKKLGQSIEEFGLVDPVIVNLKNNNIIGGHQRFDYLYHNRKNKDFYLLELGDVGWVLTDTDLIIEDEAHEKALNLALNRISGEFKIDELNSILEELAEYEMTELTGFDYDLDDFEYEFVPVEDEEDEEDDDDDVDFEEEEELSESTDEILIETETKPVQIQKENKTKIKQGTIYKNTNNIIFYGEETEENINTLLTNTIPTKEYDINNLKLIKTTKIPINYYITNSEELIKTLLKDSSTHRVR